MFNVLRAWSFVSAAVPGLVWSLSCAGAVGALASGCQQAQETGSGAQATSPDAKTGEAARREILDGVWRVSAQVFSRLQEAHLKNLGGMGGDVAKHSMTMVANMVLGSATGDPIHPAAFYATVKDFETATSLNWGGMVNGKWRDVETTRNCTSGTCYGLFQVDVNLERDWGGGKFCQTEASGGVLGLTAVLGGADFCAAQFWWTMAQGGAKCGKLNRGGANPCTSAGVAWTEAFVDRGRSAYVQAVQPGWPENQWQKMYQFYIDIARDQESALGTTGDSKALLRASTNRWLRDAGLVSLVQEEAAEVVPQNTSENAIPNSVEDAR